MKRLYALTLVIALGLAACGPTELSLATPGESTLAPVATSAGVSSEATAEAVKGVPTEAPTSEPRGGDDETPAPDSNWAPTPIPTVSGGLSPSTLKYQVLALYPDLFFCDPDAYPVATANEEDLAQQRFPQLQKNDEEFNAILNHLGASVQATYSVADQLAIYGEHKRLAAVAFEKSGDGYQFQLQTRDSDGHGFLVTGLISGQGEISAEQSQPAMVECPICLSAGALIDTPNGQVAVAALQVGDLVWTVDAAGARVAAPLAAVGHVPAPLGHLVVHIVLADGREVRASAGHPLADGRPLGVLRAGDTLDGARVVSADRELYGEPATYDILPAGATGLYWANGVLLGSTIR
jgi:hypothetical protein